METLKDRKLLSYFPDWMKQEEEDLEELLQALTRNPNNEELYFLAEKVIKHFEEHIDFKALLAQLDSPAILSPSWCTSFENAFLWIGGYRPSLPIHLLFSLSGYEKEDSSSIDGESKDNLVDESQPVEYQYREDENYKRYLGDLSAHQLNSINTLHCNAVKEEDNLSIRMASFQENIGDDPLALITKNWSQIRELNEDIEGALNAQSLALADILVEADKLRLSILKELMRFLTPLQYVDLLAATMQLHILMHHWGKTTNQSIPTPPPTPENSII